MSQASLKPSSPDGRPWIVASKLLFALAQSEHGVGNAEQYNRYNLLSRACHDLALGRDVIMEHAVFVLINEYKKQAVIAYTEDPECFDTCVLPD